MSLEQKAKDTLDIFNQIERYLNQMRHFCTLVLTEHTIEGEIIKYSDADKQKIINGYIKVKTKLATLVSELP